MYKGETEALLSGFSLQDYGNWIYVTTVRPAPRMERIPPSLSDLREQINAWTDPNQKLRGCNLLQEMKETSL